MGRGLHAPLRPGARGLRHATAPAEAQRRVVSRFPAGMNMIKVAALFRFGLACACAGFLALGASAATPAAAVHPQLWPEARSRGLIDAATEARIGELLARMSVEEKVGQI